MHLHRTGIQDDLRKIGVGLVLGGLATWYFRDALSLNLLFAILYGSILILTGNTKENHS